MSITDEVALELTVSHDVRLHILQGSHGIVQPNHEVKSLPREKIAFVCSLVTDKEMGLFVET